MNITLGKRIMNIGEEDLFGRIMERVNPGEKEDITYYEAQQTITSLIRIESKHLIDMAQKFNFRQFVVASLSKEIIFLPKTPDTIWVMDFFTRTDYKVFNYILSIILPLLRANATARAIRTTLILAGIIIESGYIDPYIARRI